MTYRLLVTGSRNWPHLEVVRAALNDVLARHGEKRIVVVHGACPEGVDAVADDWAEYYSRDVDCEPNPAKWSEHGKRAGFVRNAEMVELGADECLAFIARCIKQDCRRKARHGSHGATGCAELAEAAGIITRRWTDLR